MSVFFDHGVEDDEQLSHAGGYDYFEQFPFGFEAIGELADDEVASPGGQGGPMIERSLKWLRGALAELKIPAEG